MVDRVGLIVRPTSAPKKVAAVGSGSLLTTYEADIYRWANEQAKHLRAKRLDRVDLINVADEIEDLGQRQYDAVVSNLKVVLTHMLEWDFQPHKRSRSWASSIGEHRDRVEYTFDVSPSLAAKREQLLVRAYKMARGRASRETRLNIDAMPAICPYDWETIMTRPFVLDQTDETA